MTAQIEITPSDAETFHNIAEKFSNNVIANYQGDARKAFSKSLTLSEKLGIIVTKLSAMFNANAASSEKRTYALANYCSAVLPVMTRTFGEEFLVNAMPEEARNQRVADICKQLGFDNLAGLSEKAIQLS